MLASALPVSATPPPYRWTTFASRASVGSDDGPVSLARFDEPRGAAFDASGNLYISDTGNCTIRKITPAGIVSTLAGLAGQPGSADGTGPAARFKYPDGLATDAAGNLYVADSGGATVRKITPAGVVSTFAGQAGIALRQDGPLATATFASPSQLACAPNGDLYVLDGGAIRRIANGQVQTVVSSGDSVVMAGSSYVLSVVGPGLAVDATGQLLISASLQVPTPFGSSPTTNYPGVYRRDVQGNLTAVIGGLPPNNSGAIVSYGRLAIDGGGRVLALLSSQWEGSRFPLWRVTPGGASEQLDNISGANGGNIQSFGVAVNAGGDICYTREDNVIMRLPAGGGGPGVYAGTVDGGANGFESPSSLAVDTAQNLWVGDLTTWIWFGRGSASQRLVKVTPAGLRSTVVPPSYMYEYYYTTPAVVAGDAQGNIFFIHGLGRQDTLTRVDPAGTVTAENFVAPGGTTRFTQLGNGATSAVIDRAGNFILPDYVDHVIRVRSPGGAWSILAGKEGEAGSVDGSGAAVRFGAIRSIAMDRAGNYFVLDATISATGAVTHCFIRKITSAGVVTTVSADLVRDASVTSGSSGLSSGLAVDSQGMFYLTYGSAGTVWRLTPAGELDLIGGTTGENGTADGIGPDARFIYPTVITVDAQDRLYVADIVAHTLRQGVLVTEAPQITVQPQAQTVNAGTTVQFSVTATGYPPPAYQWYFGGTAIAGATGSSLTVSNAQLGSAGNYTVKATNSFGSATSRDAHLSVIATPAQPAPSGGGGGGGGASSPWFHVLLATAGIARWFHRHRQRAGRP